MQIVKYKLFTDMKIKALSLFLCIFFVGMLVSCGNQQSSQNYFEGKDSAKMAKTPGQMAAVIHDIQAFGLQGPVKTAVIALNGNVLYDLEFSKKGELLSDAYQFKRNAYGFITEMMYESEEGDKEVYFSYDEHGKRNLITEKSNGRSITSVLTLDEDTYLPKERTEKIVYDESEENTEGVYSVEVQDVDRHGNYSCSVEKQGERTNYLQQFITYYDDNVEEPVGYLSYDLQYFDMHGKVRELIETIDNTKTTTYKFSEDGRLIKEGSCELADDGVLYSPDSKRSIMYVHAPYILKRVETILTDEEVQSVESFYVYHSGGLRMKECTWGIDVYSENSMTYDDQANLIVEDRIFPNGEADRDTRKWKYLRRDSHGNWLGKLSSPYEVTRKITYYE